MKHNKLILVISFAALFAACDPLNTKVDTLFTQEQINSDYSKLKGFGYAPYSFLPNGFYGMDGNINAAMSDEAAYTPVMSNVRLFNEGTWNQYYNPDDDYSNCYKGIKAALYFLNYSQNYMQQLAVNRDTLSDGGGAYRIDVADIQWLRAESHVLCAYYYYELLKRYGDVPLVTDVLSTDANLPRTNYDDVVNYAVGQIDSALDSLQTNWKSVDITRDGRFTRGAAMALKSRLLLYAASPLHNSTGNMAKWEKAAAAAYDVIQLKQYSLSNNYQTLFLDSASATNNEVIMAFRTGANNFLEKANYPIGTPGGNSGVTPSQNLVDDYEYKSAADPNNPYANRDPRLQYSIVVNNSTWNGRTMQIYSGGTDDPANPNTSRTGYYLKKFLLDNLYLTQNETRIHNWIMFRYAEILLNYAEAMNEAYGSDNNNGYTLTARQAVNLVRARTGVAMPPVTATNQDEMRTQIKHERRVELAFEDHRFWDLLRWKDAETVMNKPLRGITVTKVDDTTFNYNEITVENRLFSAPKMYLYPISYSEISKSKGVLVQNQGWE
jgi:hypothetical protein